MLTCLLATVLGLAPAPACPEAMRTLAPLRAPAQDEAARTLALLRTPAQALKLEGGGAGPGTGFILPLLKSYARLMGWELALEPELESALAKTELDLQFTGEIARDDVHPLVQSLARLRGLCFRLDTQPGATRLLVERGTGESGRKALDKAIAIPLELLPAWTNHPAFLLAIEIPHAPEGSAELGTALGALLGHGPLPADISRAGSGALRLKGSAAALEFVDTMLRDGPRLASALEAATFPPDPNTPAGRAAAVLPESLRAVFPMPGAPLTLHAEGTLPSELEVALEYGRWTPRALLFLSEETRRTLAHAPGGADMPQSVPPAWAHEFVSGLLADAQCALTPLPAQRPALFVIERHPAQGAVALDAAGLLRIKLAELASVGHLAATRFQTFARLPKLSPAQRDQIRSLESPDPKAPFWITQLDDPQVFSLIGTPRAITSAVLALRLVLMPPKAR